MNWLRLATLVATWSFKRVRVLWPSRSKTHQTPWKSLTLQNSRQSRQSFKRRQLEMKNLKVWTMLLKSARQTRFRKTWKRGDRSSASKRRRYQCKERKTSSVNLAAATTTLTVSLIYGSRRRTQDLQGMLLSWAISSPRTSTHSGQAAKTT